MEYELATGVTVNPDNLANLIGACKNASLQLSQALNLISLNERFVRQEWAHDEVSLEIARYYEEQVFYGENSSYSTLTAHAAELGSTIETLQQILSNYQNVEADTAASMDQL